MALCLGALATTEAEARITRIEIKRSEQAFEGKAFGNVGAYQKIVGRAYGEVDPKDPRNAIIVDLDKARALRVERPEPMTAATARVR